MSSVFRLLRYWLPVVVLAAVIFFQSSFATPNVVPRWPGLDKLAHAAAFGLLSALICRALNSLPRWRGRVWRLWLASALLATLYGLSDEWHQVYVPYRSADAADLLADMGGSVAGALIYLRTFARLKRRRAAAA